MSPKLKLSLIRRCSDRGFALPIAVAMGFIMLLIATTLLMRSQTDQAFAKTQMRTAQSLSISEIGVTRALAAMRGNTSLAALFDYDSTALPAADGWSNPLGIGTTNASQLVGIGTGDDRWVAITTDPNDPSSEKIGYFKIVSYDKDDPGSNVGTLKVSGKTPEENITTLSVQVSYPTATPKDRGISVVEWHREEAIN